MGQALFLSADARCRDSWREAFPDLLLCDFKSKLRGDGIVWVLKPPQSEAASVVKSLQPALVGRPVALMADAPQEAEALAALAAGASCYCNGHAAPGVLKQIATVVENGGIWIGQGLLQRVLAATDRRVAQEASEPAWQENLTQREQEAARLLSKGASNKEIARQLDITERTVKAHVGAMLEKLGARDRVQLTLIIHGIEAPLRPQFR